MKTPNTTHTPGPWTFNGDHVVAGTHTVLADPFASDALFGGEGEANARLIAAAPDLLAALVKLVAFAAQYTGDGCNEAEGAVLDTAHANAEPLDNMVDTARAAIARATGKGQQP